MLKSKGSRLSINRDYIRNMRKQNCQIIFTSLDTISGLSLDQSTTCYVYIFKFSLDSGIKNAREKTRDPYLFRVSSFVCTLGFAGTLCNRSGTKLKKEAGKHVNALPPTGDAAMQHTSAIRA